jgi:glycosyltransferase involved in cell wall biosynthesis
VWRDDLMRIAMIIQRFRPAFSGQGIQVEIMTQALARRGVDVSIITATAGRDRSVERLEGYSVVRLGDDPSRFLPVRWRHRLRGVEFAARVFSFLESDRSYDVIHVHASTDALYSSYAWCWWHDTPLMFEMTLLGADDAQTMLRTRHRLSWLRRRIFGRCDGYVAISPVLQESYREAGLPPSKIRLVPQGVDLCLFSPSERKLALREALGLPTDGPVIIFVGSLVHRKGIDVLLRAWSEVSAARPEAHLVLVGRNRFPEDSGDARFLKEQLSQVPARAAQRVYQSGVRDDVNRWLQAADLFVFPSRREGFGSVMIEAMACGLPCVVTDQPGITDFIFGADGDRGVVAPQEDHAAFAAAVLEILRNPKRATQIGLAARDDVIRRFDIEQIAERYVSFYTELMARVKTSPGV